jgi:hypothetical protein
MLLRHGARHERVRGKSVESENDDEVGGKETMHANQAFYLE